MVSFSDKKLQSLWQEVARFPFLESDRAMHYFLTEVGKLLSCVSVTWIGSSLDKDVSAIPAMETINGWYVVDLMNADLEPCPLSPEELHGLYFQMVQKHGLDPLTELAVAGVGELRGHIRTDCYDDETWARHWHRTEYLVAMEVSEGMVIGIPVDAQAECYHTYQRGEGAAPFTPEEKSFAMKAAAGVAWLHRRLMLMRGALLPQDKLLSPQEKVVIKSLLGGAREKEIAIDLDVAQQTAHSHISAIYRKLGVSGKSGLVAQIMAA